MKGRYVTDDKCPKCENRVFAFVNMSDKLLCKKCNELFNKEMVIKK